MMKSTKCGAVVIGRNEGERLRHCLNSLLGGGLTIVYVDSNSVDGSAALAQPYGDGDVIVWQSAAGNLFSVGAR